MPNKNTKFHKKEIYKNIKYNITNIANTMDIIYITLFDKISIIILLMTTAIEIYWFLLLYRKYKMKKKVIEKRKKKHKYFEKQNQKQSETILKCLEILQESEDKINHYKNEDSYRKKEYEKKYKELLLKEEKLETKFVKTKKRYQVTFILLIIVFVCNYRRPMKAISIEVFSEIQRNLDTDKKVEGINQVEKEEKESEEKESVEKKEEKTDHHIMENKLFYLNSDYIDKEEETEANKKYFFVEEINNNKFSKDVISHIKKKITCNSSDTFTGKLTKPEETIISQASDKEIIFKNNIEKVKKYASENDYQMWIKSFMHSSSYIEEVLEPRKLLAKSGKCNANLAFLIANGYKLLADEYKNQAGNFNTELYYYIESILWSEKALSYQSDQKERYLNFLKGRYCDIKDSITFKDKKNKHWKFAKEVYGLYDKYEY